MKRIEDSAIISNFLSMPVIKTVMRNMHEFNFEWKLYHFAKMPECKYKDIT